MLGFKKKVQPAKKRTAGRKYKQLAVTTEAHAAVVKSAAKNNKTIIDTVDELVGV